MDLRADELRRRGQEQVISVSVLDMSMSLDGYIASPNDKPGNPGGDGFVRLHEWGLTPDGEFRRSGPAGEVLGEMAASGAVLAGRRTAEQVDHWGDDHNGQGIPIFVGGCSTCCRRAWSWTSSG